MILKAFSIFDVKAEAYLPPFFCPTPAVALRNFTQAANEEGHAFNIHAEDYCLFSIGEFDDSNGVFTPTKEPQALGLAINYIQPRDKTVALSEVK